MSGSPLSQRAASDASEHNHLPAAYPTSISQDAYRSSSAQPSPTDSQISQGFSKSHDPFHRIYPYDHPEKMAHGHGYQPSKEFPPRPLSYAGPIGPGSSQAIPLGAFGPGSESSTASYPLATRPPPGEVQQPYTSPKSQRKAKGHVASACVPCKRAHLRCDAQRPCSRCLSNGKEETCIDVQHKKRGRPRLREDRDQRYELQRIPMPPEPVMRRPLSVYGASGPVMPAYDTQPHDPHQQRVLKPHPGEHSSRYLERPPPNETAAYGQVLSGAGPPPEPVAYLTIDLDFSRASETFLEAVGGYRDRRTLENMVLPSDRAKILALRDQILAEQKQREPNYLPPILDRGDQVLQSLGFGVRDVSRFQLNRQEYLAFDLGEGQSRVYPVRLGLEKEGSFYFVVLVLALTRTPWPSASPHERTAPQPYYSPGSSSQSPYGPPPGSMAHDLNRHRLSEGPVPSRPAVGMHQLRQSPSPGVGPTGSSFPGLSSRPEFSSPAYHTTRPEARELQPPSRPSYQLPPIRAPPERESSGSDRSGRVDIGGLIQKPEAQGRPH